MPSARRTDTAASKKPALPLELRESLDDFLIALRAEAGAARNTLVAYAADIERFFAFAAEKKRILGSS